MMQYKKSQIVDCTNKNTKSLKEYLSIYGVDRLHFKFNKCKNKQNIAVVGAGMSEEREVSLMSSDGIVNSLIALGHQVMFIDMGQDIASLLEEIRPDIVFNALHGTYGEDGCLQGLLNIMRIPYTGAGVVASATALNKLMSYSIFQAHNIRIANYQIIKKSDNFQEDPMLRPYVIKPLSQGSSIGVKIIFDGDDFNFKDYDFPYGDDVIVEQYISGRELQVAILNGKAIDVLEIKILQGKRFYDYEAKYTDGFAEHLLPSPINHDIKQKLLEISEYVCKIFSCNIGIIRAEFIYHEAENEIYMLELNTHPGMTPLSICPEILSAKGISYTELVNIMLQHAKFEE